MVLVAQNGHNPLENSDLQWDVINEFDVDKILFLQLGEAHGSVSFLNYDNFKAQIENALTFARTVHPISVEAPILVDSSFHKISAESYMDKRGVSLPIYTVDDDISDAIKQHNTVYVPGGSVPLIFSNIKHLGIGELLVETVSHSDKIYIGHSGGIMPFFRNNIMILEGEGLYIPKIEENLRGYSHFTLWTHFEGDKHNIDRELIEVTHLELLSRGCEVYTLEGSLNLEIRMGETEPLKTNGNLGVKNLRDYL